MRFLITVIALGFAFMYSLSLAVTSSVWFLFAAVFFLVALAIFTRDEI